MRDAAIEAALRTMRELQGNPSGAHSLGQRARTILEDARDEIAELLGAQAREIVFTGGGTEAANLAIAGALGAKGGNAVCSSFEHHAVLKAVEKAQGKTCAVTAEGMVDLSVLAELLDDSTSIVSVMAVNNEVGTIQDISATARTVKNRAPAALLHSDAVQALPWLDIAKHTKDAHLVSVSAHKVGGPMGVGALVVREGTPIDAQVVGGGQERELRSGTQNVAGIAAFAAALRECADEREETVKRVEALRDELLDGLLARCSGLVQTVPREMTAAGFAHVTFDDLDSESLLFVLDDMGVCASGGASCASGAMQPSHVLIALGTAPEVARNGLRLTLGRTTSPADVHRALEVIPKAVDDLRGRRIEHKRGSIDEHGHEQRRASA